MAQQTTGKGLLNLLTMPEIMEHVATFARKRTSALTGKEFFYVRAAALSGTCYRLWEEKRCALIAKQTTLHRTDTCPYEWHNPWPFISSQQPGKGQLSYLNKRPQEHPHAHHGDPRGGGRGRPEAARPTVCRLRLADGLLL